MNGSCKYVKKNSVALVRERTIPRLTAVGIRCADHVTPFYPQKLALTSPTGGGRSVGIVVNTYKLISQFINWDLRKSISVD